ncbi:MAG: HPr family phosphocarrier protein [Pseudomonadales bacterium]
MHAVDIEIINKLGLHARAASKLVSVTTKYASDIKIAKGETCVDGKSIMSLMMLAATKGTVLQIRASGDDQAEAIAAISALIDNRFDEAE